MASAVAPLALVIGDKNLSSWSLRPWLAMKQAGIPFEEHLFLFDAPGWRDRVVLLSPSRRVPVLRHGDTVICESLAICEYVAELHPAAGLWPEDREARAIARAVSAEMHSGFGALRQGLTLDVTARVPRPTLSHEAEADLERVESLWEDCRARFGAGGPFLFGRFSIADAMYAPVVFRLRTYTIAPREAVRGYCETMLSLPAMQAWAKDAEAEVRAREARPKGAAPDPTNASHVYAVIFTSRLASFSPEYDQAAREMVELAKEEPGFIGIESARNADGFGITVSYWSSHDAIARFRARERHREAQQAGRASFYSSYEIRVAYVERGYRFPRTEGDSHGSR